jgi:hypothetical protein
LPAMTTHFEIAKPFAVSLKGNARALDGVVKGKGTECNRKSSTHSAARSDPPRCLTGQRPAPWSQRYAFAQFCPLPSVHAPCSSEASPFGCVTLSSASPSLTAPCGRQLPVSTFGPTHTICGSRQLSGARRGPAGRFADRRVLARSPGVGCPVSDTALHCVALVLDRPLARPALELGRWAALDPKISLDCALALHTALRRRSERGDRVYVGLLVIVSVDLDCGRLRVRGLRLAFETSQAS